MGRTKVFTGRDIDISFDMSRCIHARNCFLKLPQVFDPAKRPWVSPDAAPAEEIAAMIRTCPSGALQFTRRDGGVEEQPTATNRVSVLENGPLSLQGDLSVNGEPCLRATLCRCGRSANKPFCDYAHVDGGFVASGEPQPDAKEAVQGETADLQVSTVQNGPLKLEGQVEITSGTGHRIAVTGRAFLCRCGASRNKPYCDGSHKDAGFTD